MKQPDLNLVDTPEQAEALVRWAVGLNRNAPVGIDTETNGKGRAAAQVLRTVQFGDIHTGWVVPIDEYRGHVRHVLDLIRARGNPVAIHNTMFDLDVLETAGLPLPHRHQIFDTMILAMHIDNVRPAGLKDLCLTLGITPWIFGLDKKLGEVFRKSKWTWETIPWNHPIYWRYSAMDPVSCVNLLVELQRHDTPAYADDITFMEVMRASYRRGIAIDHTFRGAAIDTLEATRQKYEQMLDRDYGLTNLGANDIGERLEALLDVRLPRTGTGQVSTSKDALAGVDHPAASELLAWRAARNEVSKVRDWLDTERVQPTLRPWSTDPDSPSKARTGRAATVEPNLQAFTGADKGPLRDCLVPDEGHVFVAIDYANQELRLMAHFTKDKELTRALVDGMDVHQHVADLIGCARPTAKTLNFALPYGAGVDNLAGVAGVSHDEMKAILARLDEQFPGMARFVQSHEGREWQTISGRTVRPDPLRPYTAGNYRIQGSGADVLKTAAARIEAAGLSHTICATVHDEFLFQFPVDEAEELTVEVSALMDRPETYPPLTVTASPPVERWGQAK